MRSLVVTAARSWTGTPYHHMGRVKHVGVDCGQIIIASFEEAGLCRVEDPGMYTCDWHLHRDEDRYLALVEQHLVRAPGCETEQSSAERIKGDPFFAVGPGSVLVWRIGRTFSHGGIVTKWPFFIHASLPAGMVEEVSLVNCAYVSERPMRVYTHEAFLV